MPAPAFPGLSPLNQQSSVAAFYTHTPYAYVAVPDAYRTRPQPSPVGLIDPQQDADPSDGFRTVGHSFSSAVEHPAARVVRSVADPFADGMYYKQPFESPLEVTQYPRYGAQRPQMHHVPTTRPQQLGSNWVQPSNARDRGAIQTNQLRPSQLTLNSYPQRNAHPQGQIQPKSFSDDVNRSTPHNQSDREDLKSTTSTQRRTQANSRFHTPLNGICEFLPLPDHIETPAHWPSHRVVETDGSTVRAFIGQVRFETTAEQIAYIIEHTSGVSPAFVAYHRVGCFVAHFLTVEDCEMAVQYHKRVYFDTTGVWVANTDEALAAMNEEIDAVANGPRRTAFRRRRLPRGGMVIEQFTDADAGSPMRLTSHTLTANNSMTVPPTPRPTEEGDAEYYD